MINVALPKGRIGDKVRKIFSQIGYECEEPDKDDRRLVIENADGTIRYLLIKPSDVGVYVERGAADIGVLGKDTITETNPDIFELADLNIGKCKMCVCAPNDWEDDPDSVLRVATKYPNIAKTYYSSVNRQIEIIKLNGSIELAPILGLSDVIVDIVETGTTLKENNLHPVLPILDISARLIANKSSYRFKSEEIENITRKIKELNGQ
ncbi:MAG: ATP phosphoribosyltransferase [Ruminococcaceae bacterium]|nr:ATP phosphoribosyltransferase [Oscillospiraceae bacterium]